MNELPNELIQLIFNHVDLIDLVKNCKLVQKRWIRLIDAMKFDELIINFNKFSTNHWFYFYKSINAKYIVQCNMPKCFKSLSFKNHYVRLKRLKIDCLLNDFDIEQLNFFSKLEHLQILSFLELDEDKKLILSNLKILKLSMCSNYKLTIDAVKLEVLNCNHLFQIQLAHANSIRQLEIENNFESLNGFCNLEILKIHSLLEPDEDAISKLPNSIKELHYDQTFNSIDLTRKRFFINLIQEQKQFKQLNELKLYFDGVELEAGKAFDDYHFNFEILELHHRNYGRLADSLTSYSYFIYNNLMNAYNHSIPTNFFNKFINIQHLTAFKIKNQNQFLNFLKNCSNLKELHLDCTSLDQTFFDQLGSLNLIKFHLKEKDSIQIDYEFILKFQILVSFLTTQHLPFSFALIAIKRFKFIDSIQFKNKDRSVKICKIKNSKFNLNYGKLGKQWSSICYSKLCELCKDSE